MIVRLFFLTIVAAVIMACGGVDQGQSFDPPAGYEPRTGEKIYQKHCKICHGKDGTRGASGATDLSKSRLDSAGIVSIIRNGRNTMSRQIQHFKSDEEIENVVKYIKTLRK